MRELFRLREKSKTRYAILMRRGKFSNRSGDSHENIYISRTFNSNDVFNIFPLFNRRLAVIELKVTCTLL